MRFLIMLILLAFPFAEIYLLIQLGDKYGWWLLLYLVVIGYLGLQLIRGEKLLISAKMMQSLAAGDNPIKTMLGSARNMVAGVLLIIPGIITDVIAVVLLLIPIQKSKPNLAGATNTDNQQQPFEQPYQTNKNFTQKQSKAANDDVIEGEYTKIDDDKK